MRESLGAEGTTMKSFVGKAALITGASQGIGKAIAAALDKQGAQLVLAGRSIQRLEAAASEITSNDDVKPMLLAADLAHPPEVDKLARQVQGRFDMLHVLVHCAAAYRREPWEGTTQAALHSVFETNLFAPAALTCQLLPKIRRARGDIVFVNSSVVRGSGAGTGAYAASKHALRSLADSLRAEVSSDGIRVLSVYPGRAATPLQAAIHGMEGSEYTPAELLQPSDVAQAVLSSLLLPVKAELTDLHIRPSPAPLKA